MMMISKSFWTDDVVYDTNVIIINFNIPQQLKQFWLYEHAVNGSNAMDAITRKNIKKKIVEIVTFFAKRCQQQTSWISMVGLRKLVYMICIGIYIYTKHVNKM